MTNTALSAKAEQIAQNVTFRNEEHKKFFLTYLPKCRYGDVYHVALVYCLGIDADTRRNIKAIYDFKTGCVKTEFKGNLMIALHDGWITSGSAKVVRMAFNLYNKGAVNRCRCTGKPYCKSWLYRARYIGSYTCNHYGKFNQ